MPGLPPSCRGRACAWKCRLMAGRRALCRYLLMVEISRIPRCEVHWLCGPLPLKRCSREPPFSPTASSPQRHNFSKRGYSLAAMRPGTHLPRAAGMPSGPGALCSCAAATARVRVASSGRSTSLSGSGQASAQERAHMHREAGASFQSTEVPTPPICHFIGRLAGSPVFQEEARENGRGKRLLPMMPQKTPDSLVRLTVLSTTGLVRTLCQKSCSVAGTEPFACFRKLFAGHCVRTAGLMKPRREAQA